MPPAPDLPPVLILMATLNGAAYLRAQLESLAAQTHRNWALWVSDDGSTDDTRALLAGFARQHPVHLVEGPRTGSAAANFLHLICHPDLPTDRPVALCDQDDVWLPGKLAAGLGALAQAGATGPALYGAESHLVAEDLRPLSTSSAPGARPGFGNALVQNLFSGHTSILDPEALALVRRAGPQPGVPFHDWWIYQLISGAGGHLHLDPRPMALYRQHGANALGARQGLGGGLSRLASLDRGEFRRWSEANRTALASVADLLTTRARETLAALTAPDVPRSGLARARLFRRLGLVRSSPAGTAALLAAAFMGRA